MCFVKLFYCIFCGPSISFFAFFFTLCTSNDLVLPLYKVLVSINDCTIIGLSNQAALAHHCPTKCLRLNPVLHLVQLIL